MNLSVKFCLSMILSAFVLSPVQAQATSPAVPEPEAVLLEQLKDKQLRYSAIEKLLKADARKTAPEIAELLDDEDFNVRFAALRALVGFNDRRFTREVWKLFASEQDSQLKSYAMAALVFFGDDKAIQSLEAQLAADIVGGMEVLAFIGNLNARAAVPAFVSILEKGKISDHRNIDVAARRAIIVCLGRLKGSEAIPVLRKYARTESFFQKWEAIRVLGDLEAREAVDDLIFVLDDALTGFDGAARSDNYHTVNNSAVALARIGDKKALPLLLKTVSHPKFSHGGQVIRELNRHLDRELWERAEKQKVSGFDFKSIKFTIDSINRENGVKVILDFEPGKDLARRASLEGLGGYPWTSVGANANLLAVVRKISSAISDDTVPENFTFVFDHGKIRILSVEKAILWWEKNVSVNRPIEPAGKRFGSLAPKKNRLIF
jgi:HEAT repeat protein